MHLVCMDHTKRVFVSGLSGRLTHADDNTYCGTIHVQVGKEQLQVADILDNQETP